MVLGVLLNHVSGSLEFVLSCFYGIKIGQWNLALSFLEALECLTTG